MAKFTWNVKDLKFKDMDSKAIHNYVETCGYSLQEMQDAWDEYSSYYWKWTDIWRTYNLFESEKDTIKVKGTDWYGRTEYNTNSLKAWAKKHNIPVDAYNTVGYYTYSWHTGVHAVNTTKEKIESNVPYVFERLITLLKDKEYKYFIETDERQIKLSTISDNIKEGYPMPFKKDIHYSEFPFRGTIWREDKDGNEKEYRELTMDELNQIIVFHNAIANAVKNVIDTQSPNIDV